MFRKLKPRQKNCLLYKKTCLRFRENDRFLQIFLSSTYIEKLTSFQSFKECFNALGTYDELNGSSNVTNFFEELYYSKLRDKIAEDIKENTNTIIRKQLPDIEDKPSAGACSEPG